MKILYMGYFCDEVFFNQLVQKGAQVSHARERLEYKLLSGMTENLREEDSMMMISYLPKIACKRKRGECWKGIPVLYLWCNKQNPFSVLKAILWNTKKIVQWCSGRKNSEKIVFMYGVNPLHAMPALILRTIFKYKVVTLMPEISVYRRIRRTEKREVISKASRRFERLLDHYFDGYILLTKYMNEIVNRKNKPSMVMEGIADSVEQNEADVSEKKHAVLYAGGLRRDNGVEVLLEAFSGILNSEWELWICGDGELRKQTIDYEKRCKNIKYFGVISNKEVQRFEKTASLLINPRLTANEFTKYSFPSKTIEYMSSGTAAAVTRLAGIPDEYFQYVYVWEEESTEGLRQFLEELFSFNEEELYQKGREAQKFVLENKSMRQQGKRVMSFLRSMLEDKV